MHSACDLLLPVRHKFLPREQFTLEFYYRLKFYAAARDLNFAETICARLRLARPNLPSVPLPHGGKIPRQDKPLSPLALLRRILR